MNHTPVIALVSVLALTGCNLHGRPTIERKSRPAGPERAVATETATPETVVSPGIVEPWGSEVELSAQEPGRIAAMLVSEGDRVEPGQVLATLDDSAQQHAVELATADVAESKAALARLERGATSEELQQAQADSDAAAAQDQLASAAAGRTAGLHRDGIVSDDAFDRASAEARTQAAIARRANARLAELKRGSRTEDLQAAQARLESAQARLGVAQASLLRRRVVAASAGTVLLSRQHAGEFYTPGAAALFVIGDLTRLQIRLEVDDIDAAVPTPGAPCDLYSDAGVTLAKGTVVRLAPKLGRRALPLESPTARADVRVREVFVQVASATNLVPNQRVWGHIPRTSASR
jgi:HlyD family secretion protein